MKKIVVLAVSLLLVLAGCGKKTKEDLMSKFEKVVNNSKSYTLKGNMEILSNEETYTYSLEANYLQDNFYKVTLVNETNNHEQIILKNKDGVYVVTPTLNKSFKFQSEWPDSSSQSYILSSLVKDIKNDKNATLEEENKGYIIKSTVNYPNNADLSYQKIYFDKDMNIERVEVYDTKNIVVIKATFRSVNLKAGLSESDFKLENFIDITIEDDKNSDVNKDKENNKDNQGSESNNTTDKDNNNENNEKPNNNTNNEANSNNSSCENEECDTKSSNIIDSIIYPLYIPSQTYLSNSEKVDTDSGNRVILTFAGDKNFVLIEEVANIAQDFEVIPVYGDPIMLSDTIAAKSANSMYWTSNNISYYLTSSDLSTSEMVTIAESLGNAKVVSSVSGSK